MRNTYFQFKQFRIEQDKCAMKVCTDSCLFGAFIEVQHANRVLDIGTGTGLLSLMVAQRTDASIDAVEINQEAAQQAEENFKESLWSDRLLLHPVSLQEFAKTNIQQYDVILSNPPFFQASLRSGDAAKDAAKHTGELFFEDILSFTQHSLTETGTLYLLLPPREAQHFASLSPQYGLHLKDSLHVYTYERGQCIRHIQQYTFSPVGTPNTRSLHIREADKVTYTPAFREVLKGYYLNF